MNPELKQRLIGAAVVTALATIFIPMLFDDPVENTGQSVSELSIPAAPIKSTEVSANKLPTPANKTPKKPNAAEPANPEGEPVTDAEMVDDAEAEATTEPPVNESTPTPADAKAVAEAEQLPAAEEESEPLDTGVIPEAKPSVKKPTTKPIKPVVDTEVPAKVKLPIKKIETNTPKLSPATKPADVVVATKPVIKTPPTAKPVVVGTPEKAAKTPELVRWTIHAGSFGQKDNATTLMKTLREQGIPVSIETIPSAKGPMYRLKIGPELDKKKAAANKAKLDKQGVNNVLISE
jgi:DedD protein